MAQLARMPILRLQLESVTLYLCVLSDIVQLPPLAIYLTRVCVQKGLNSELLLSRLSWTSVDAFAGVEVKLRSEKEME